MDKQLEMTAELRRARGWILGVGLVGFGFDMLWLFVINSNLPRSIQMQFTMYSVIVLGFFIAMWVLARWKPVLACALALAGFWALQLYVASQNGASIFQGILIKVLFTLALIKGIKSANRAERLKKELSQIFG